MLKELRPAIGLIALFTLVLGVAFPVALSGVFGLVLPRQANGDLIMRNNRPVGSGLIGQDFTSPSYFQPRPSALTGTDPEGRTVPTPYDAGESGASNLAPTSQALLDAVKARVARYRAKQVPTDAVTASGSGLDPDISPQNAELQVARVAAARHLPPDQVSGLVRRYTEGRILGFIGEPRVNVLRLNLALDALAAKSAAASR